MPTNQVIIIAGPTASGKSKLAIDTAVALKSVVINADSMQVYKDIPIITAAPSAEDKEKIPHHLYEIYDPSFRGNVALWLESATNEIKTAWQKSQIPVIVGGTGLYIENLIQGVSPIPETPADIQQTVQQLIDQNGITFLYQQLQEKDPSSAKRLAPNDTSRVKRAYEVLLATGKPMSAWRKLPLIQKLPEAKFFVIKICPSVEELDTLSYYRFDKMVEMGCIDEVQKLYKRKLNPTLPAMKALGVPELIEYLSGKTNVYQAVQNAKLHTRQYCKRQRTWFKNRLTADFELKECYKGCFPNEILEHLQ